MRKALLALTIALALAVVCNPISAEGTDPEGCSAEHPELCIEPQGCSSPDSTGKRENGTSWMN